MLIYNVHTLQKTFALTHKDGETYDSLFDRISKKAGLHTAQAKALKSGQEGGLVYEYKGEKYSLEDDDDLAILHEREPPSSTQSVTLHLTVPVSSGSQNGGQSQSQGHAHAHFASSPPTYSTAAGNVKSKAQRSQSNGAPASALKNPSKTSESNGKSSSASNGNSPSRKTKDQSNGSGNGSSKLAPPLPLTATFKASGDKEKNVHSEKGKDASGGETKSKDFASNGNGSEGGAKPAKKAQSVMSTKSRRSKWGDDDAEPMHVVHKRNWEAFHANSGVRTIMGSVGGVSDVRMLLKSGYRNVYVSRQFAVKTGMVSEKYGMGASGYTGLKSLGNISITVGSKTSTHLAMINEEEHFDVVLGRTWLEKTGIKIDPIDQTLLTYMDNGEVIPCDIVVLKDDKGNKIFIT